MSTVPPPDQDDPAAQAGSGAFERRWDRAWELLPYLLIAGSTALAVLTAGWETAELLRVGVLVVVLLAWHGWFVTLHPQWPEHRLLPMTVYFTGLVVLSLVLASQAEAFTIMVVGCFPMAFVALPGRWAYVAVAATGVALVVAIGGSRPAPDLAAQLLGASALAAGVGWAIRRIEAEAVQRQEAVAELAALNDQLRQANQDKEQLQEHLVSAAREAGVSAERARLARDFHDTLAQGLAGIGTQLETAGELLEAGHPAGQRVDAALALSRSSLAEARRSVQALRPGPLTADDLLGALRSTVAEWSGRTGVPGGFEVTGSPVTIDLTGQTAVLRFVQEGLANVAKHAEASQATVTVSYLEDQVMVDVFDDGVGFDPAAPAQSIPGLSDPVVGVAARAIPDGGYGLSAARERLNQVGGRLSVESAPGAGATLTATLPVTATGPETAADPETATDPVTPTVEAGTP